MKKFLARLQNEEGQALVDYGLLVALIAVVCIATLLLLGPAVNAQFVAILNAL